MEIHSVSCIFMDVSIFKPTMCKIFIYLFNLSICLTELRYVLSICLAGIKNMFVEIKKKVLN